MRENPFLDDRALTEIRANTDWQGLFSALGIEKDERRSRGGEWWGHSPFSADETASFRMMADGRWFCFSTNQGGGVLELVQAVRQLNCYEAARWLLEAGLSHLGPDSPAPAGAGNPAVESESKVVASPAPAGLPPENKPVRQDLLPLLTPDHPEFARRGISAATCQTLGCGYLPEGGRSPLSDRLVFQVRGIREQRGEVKPVILTHIGRATTAEQAETGGKWHFYKGFSKTQEIYNIDRLVLDTEARRHIDASKQVVLVEGCFDVAKLLEAGIPNAGATFGAHLDEYQLIRLQELCYRTGAERFLVWYDRDEAGRRGQQQAVELLRQSGFQAAGFQWQITFPSPQRGSVDIPPELTDPCQFSPQQLLFLRTHGMI